MSLSSRLYERAQAVQHYVRQRAATRRACFAAITPVLRRNRSAPPCDEGFTLELLESRLMLSTVLWDAGGDGQSWSDLLNWVGDALPTAGDDAVLGNNDVDIDTAVVIKSLTSQGSLRISAGGLTLSDVSVVDGSFEMTVGTALTVSGADASFTAGGEVVADGANLSALNGGEIHLPGMTHYRANSTANGQKRVFQSSGAGSVLDLANLFTLIGGTHHDSDVTILAQVGGVVNLSGLTQIIDPNSGDTRRRSIQLRATGTDSRIDLSSLTRMEDVNANGSTDGQFSTLTARDGGTIDTDSLTYLIGVDVLLDGTGTIDVSGLQRVFGGRFSISNVNQDFASLTDASAMFNITGVQVDLSSVVDLS